MSPFGTIPTEKENAAEKALQLFNVARVAHSEAIERLTVLQWERPQQKTAALVRLCATTHPVTGKTYSVSQAEDVLALDEKYSEYRIKVTTAELEVREAEDEKNALWLGALLRINEVLTHPLAFSAPEVG